MADQAIRSRRTRFPPQTAYLEPARDRSRKRAQSTPRKVDQPKPETGRGGEFPAWTILFAILQLLAFAFGLSYFGMLKPERSIDSAQRWSHFLLESGVIPDPIGIKTVLEWDFNDRDARFAKDLGFQLNQDLHDLTVQASERLEQYDVAEVRKYYERLYRPLSILRWAVDDVNSQLRHLANAKLLFVQQYSIDAAELYYTLNNQLTAFDQRSLKTLRLLYAVLLNRPHHLELNQINADLGDFYDAELGRLQILIQNATVLAKKLGETKILHEDLRPKIQSLSVTWEKECIYFAPTWFGFGTPIRKIRNSTVCNIWTPAELEHFIPQSTNFYELASKWVEKVRSEETQELEARFLLMQDLLREVKWIEPNGEDTEAWKEGMKEFEKDVDILEKRVNGEVKWYDDIP